MKYFISTLITLFLAIPMLANELPIIGQASADVVIDLKSTLEQRLDRMAPEGGMLPQEKTCDFAEPLDLEILLLTLEAAMNQADRQDVRQGAKIVNNVRVGNLWIVMLFKKFENKYRLSFSGVEGEGHFDIWFRVKEDKLEITSFAVIGHFEQGP